LADKDTSGNKRKRLESNLKDQSESRNSDEDDARKAYNAGGKGNDGVADGDKGNSDNARGNGMGNTNARSKAYSDSHRGNDDSNAAIVAGDGVCDNNDDACRYSDAFSIHFYV
jgi:hypothetical protein